MADVWIQVPSIRGRFYHADGLNICGDNNSAGELDRRDRKSVLMDGSTQQLFGLHSTKSYHKETPTRPNSQSVMCNIRVGSREVEEMWKKIGPRSFQCPRCYRTTSVLGETHNCRVSDWQPYECLRCFKMIYPTYDLLKGKSGTRYQCLWCGDQLDDSEKQHLQHPRLCQESPEKKEPTCTCGNVYK